MELLWCAARPRRGRGRSRTPMPVAISRWSHELKTSEVFAADDEIPEVNMDLTGMETLSVLISRGRQGFGFTVFGSCPVQVGRVDEGSPAFNAGLRRNDYIVRINCQNVSRSMAESVARIVRETENALRIEVQRSPVANEIPTSPRWLQHLDDSPRISSSAESTSRLSITPKQQHQHQQQQPCSATAQPRLPPRRPLTTLANNNRVPQRPNALENNTDQGSSCSYESGRKSGCSESIQTRPCPRRVTGSLRSRKAPMPLPVDAEERSVNEEAQPSTDVEEGDERPSINENKSGFSLENDSPATDDKKMSSYEQIQWPAIQKLISCEEDFVLQMQKGAQRYLYPLKEEFLSPEQHWAVFQNLEEIISFSQCHVQELHRYLQSTTPGDQSDQQEPPGDCEGREILPLEGRISIGALVSVYLIKIDSFCSAYESYCPGIVDALHFLASLKKSNPSLQAYLKRTLAQDSDRFSISSFLQKPIEHIKEQVLALQKILRYMQTTTSDYFSLKRIVQSMRNCCSSINTSHIQRCNSSTSSLSSIDQQAPAKSPSLLSSSSSSSSSSHSASASVAASVTSSVVSSIDSEVLRIQSRLIFPDNVRTFHLATASHHMIYSGRLTLVEAGSSTSLFVALLSDLLVLTRPDPVGEALFVLQEPILLHDVVGCNFSCAHICEFVISIETPLKSLQNSWAPRSLALRAPSVEMKCTWKNILEQRISASKTQRDVTISSRLCSRIV